MGNEEALARNIATGLALCGFVCCLRYPRQVDRIWEPLLGSSDTDRCRQQHKCWQEWMVGKSWLAGVLLEVCSGVFYASQGDWQTVIFPVAWCVIIVMSPPTTKCGLCYLWLSGCVLLPIRGSLGAAGIMHLPSTIPTAVLHPMAGALLQESMSQHLAVTLFVNATIFMLAGTPFECIVSLSATCVSWMVLTTKLAWFRRGADSSSIERFGASNAFQTDIKRAALASIPVMICLLLLRVHEAYPGALWDLIVNGDDYNSGVLRKVVSGLSLLGAACCTWMLQQQPLKQRSATEEFSRYVACASQAAHLQLEWLYDRCTPEFRSAGLMVVVVDIAYTASHDRVFESLLNCVLLLLSLLWIILGLPPRITAQRFNLKLTSFVLLPLRAWLPFWWPSFLCGSELCSSPEAVLPSVAPTCLLIVVYATLINNSLTEQLRVALILNFVVFSRGSHSQIECVLCVLACPISVVALTMKTTKMLAAISEFDAKASQQKEEIEKLRCQQSEQAVAALLARAEQAERAEAAKAESYCQVISATAHDLRTPVAALKSGCAIMRHCRDRDQLPPKEALDSMDASMTVALEFLDSMVITAKYLSKGEGVQERPKNRIVVSLKQLVREAFACISHGLSSSTTLHYEIAEDFAQSDRLICERSLVLRSMVNFLSNASRHTSEGSITLSVKRTPDSKFVVFSVADTGEGVPTSERTSSHSSTSATPVFVLSHPSLSNATAIPVALSDTCPTGDHERIWDPFISNAGSSGLGLFVVKAHASAAGGDCGVHKNPIGPGAVFWFSIPYLAATDEGPIGETAGKTQEVHNEAVSGEVQTACREIAAVEAEKSELAERVTRLDELEAWEQSSGEEDRCDAEQDGDPRYTSDILLVDDMRVLLQMTALEIRQLGLQVDIASQPSEALKMMQACRYRLVLCDYSMGLTTGADLTLEFRKWEQDHLPGVTTRIYALTAHADAKVTTSCTQSGMQGIFHKPLDNTDLKRIKAMVQNSMQKQSNSAAVPTIDLSSLEPGTQADPVIPSPVSQVSARGRRWREKMVTAGSGIAVKTRAI